MLVVVGKLGLTLILSLYGAAGHLIKYPVLYVDDNIQ